MTEAELLEFARDLRTRWDGAWMIDGRPIGNVEMDALSTLSKHELQQLRDSGQCCCEAGPYEDGHCRRGLGRWELFDEAKKILWRADNVE